MEIVSFPNHYRGYTSLFDMKKDKGFRFGTDENYRTFWLKVDFGHQQMVIGNNLYYCVTDHGRSYVFVYKMSYSLGKHFSTNFTYWVNPETGSQLLNGITEDSQDSAIVWLEPHLARTVKYEPQGYVGNVCLRVSILFCNGLSFYTCVSERKFCSHSIIRWLSV